MTTERESLFAALNEQAPWTRPDGEDVPTEQHERRWRTFIENVKEARENGFESLCAECGVGDHNDPTMHERWCSVYEPWDGK